MERSLDNLQYFSYFDELKFEFSHHVSEKYKTLISYSGDFDNLLDSTQGLVNLESKGLLADKYKAQLLMFGSYLIKGALINKFNVWVPLTSS